MMLFRRLACAALASTLVAGCNQSLFDASPDNGRDGGSGPERPDSGIGVPDASVDPDASVGPRPDAGVQDKCPEPCVGNAVAEFGTTPGSKWRYAETLLDADDGLPLLRTMIYAAWSALPAWVGVTAPPAILSCPLNPGATECQGVEEKLLLVPTGANPGEPQPTLVWSAPGTGSFRLTADWRMANGATAGSSMSVAVARNGLFDGVFTTSFTTSTAPRVFDIEVDAVLGDTVALTMIPHDNTNVPLGVSFYATDLLRNDDCQMTFRFDEDLGPFANDCGDGPLTEKGPVSTVDAPPPPDIPGRARTFSDTSILQYEGEAIDYSGDWTLQFWAAIDGSGDGSGDILSDQTCTMTGDRFVSGGIAIKFDIDSMLISIGDEVTGRNCTDLYGAGVIVISDGPDIDDETKWHHYRVVRNKSTGTVIACVNGKYVDAPDNSITLPPAATMRTERPLDLGHRREDAAGSFLGQIADLRVYNRALPCTVQTAP